MSPTDQDLRAVLGEAAAAAGPHDPWPPLHGAIRRRRALRRAGAVALACALVGTGVALWLTGAQAPTSGGPTHLAVPLMRPTSYEQACAAEFDVCAHARAGTIPRSLFRPLHLRRVAAGAACPASRGSRATNPYVAGLQFGRAPVFMELGNQGDISTGTVVLGTTQLEGWDAIENVFVSLPAYTGPVLVRGERLDGTATVGFGTSRPVTSDFVVPPGPGANVHDGTRTPPGSIWVTSPGCYGFQIDGLTFSETVVIEALAPGSG